MNINLTIDDDFFRSLSNFLAEPIFIKDNQHRVIHANQAFYELFKTDEASTIGTTLAETVPAHEREHFLAVDRIVLDTGVADLREETLTVDGVKHIIITSKQRYTSEAGEHYLIGSIQDITRLKLSEDNLRNEKNKLEAAIQEIKTLKEVLPICSYCRKIRDDDGAWKQLEEYIATHTDSNFSHGICEDCVKQHHPKYQPKP